MTLLVVGLVAFLGIHSVRVLAPGYRDTMISRLGVGPWKGIYSLVSLSGLLAIIWGYGSARTQYVHLYSLPDWSVYLTMILMLISLVLAVSADLPVGRIKQAVKHPLLIGAKIWAIAHLLVNGDLASLVLFGSLFIWALFILINASRRDVPDPVAQSSKGDFAAIGIGLALWLAIIFWLHSWLIGVPVIAI